VSGRQTIGKPIGPEAFAFLEDRGATPSVDHSVHPAASQQRGVRGVDDRVDVLLGDVALDQRDVWHD
jgi:hypothetical protein